MNHRLTIALVTAGLLSACATTKVDTHLHRVVIDLGTEQKLTELYSWPNNPAQPESLADTIDHYLTQTAMRDGITDANVGVVKNSDNTYTATFLSNSNDILAYSTMVPDFLNEGMVAYNGAEKLKQEQPSIWKSDWRFFLPLGLAMANQKSVQLLHFPPDYSLPAQDYLGSKTSERWESLLETNGVAKNDVTLFETIIDIAPIAAPADDGKDLTQTYSYFADYAKDMLDLLAVKKEGTVNQPLPLVAYGSPVRAWLKTYFQLDLSVLEIGDATLSDGTEIPVLAANHPSYFWYAADQSCEYGWEVMQQDLIAARWQMDMGNTPSQSPSTVLTNAKTYWDASSQTPTICTLTRQQASKCASQTWTQCPTL